MLNWQAYRSGGLAIVCRTAAEAIEFMRVCRDSGIPYIDPDIFDMECQRSFRIGENGHAYKATDVSPSWHVEHGYTSDWIYFTDFVAGQSNPDFNADEFLSMLSGGEA